MSIYVYSQFGGVLSVTVNAVGGGANLVFANPDGTNTTIFLTTTQVRQFAQAVATALATNFVSITIGTIGVSVTPPPRSAQPWETAAPITPITAVILKVPGSGTASGITLPYTLPLDQAQAFSVALAQYSVTNQ
jgi:hypothetical protein